MRRTIAMALLALTLMAGTFAATGGAYALTQPPGQDESTGPYNPGIPSD